MVLQQSSHTSLPQCFMKNAIKSSPLDIWHIPHFSYSRCQSYFGSCTYSYPPKETLQEVSFKRINLLSNHIISSILSSNSSNMPNYHNLLIDLLTPKQRLHMKSALIDMDNKYNKLIPFFSFFNEEFRPGNCLIDSFSDRFSFHLYFSNINKHIEELDNTTLRVLSNMFSAIVISDTSIKNHVTTSICTIDPSPKLYIGQSMFLPLKLNYLLFNMVLTKQLVSPTLIT